jgi:hypothetical protein
MGRLVAASPPPGKSILIRQRSTIFRVSARSAVPVNGVSLIPPHPARLLVHVHLGLRVARLGTDHRSRRTF